MSAEPRSYITVRKHDPRKRTDDLDFDIDPVTTESPCGNVSLRRSTRSRYFKDLEESYGADAEKSMIAARESMRRGLLRKNGDDRFLSFVIHHENAKSHMVAWRNELFLVPLDLSVQFRNVSAEAMYCPYFLFSGFVMTSRCGREFKDLAASLPCCKPLIRGECGSTEPGDQFTFLDRDLVQKLNCPWPFHSALTRKMGKGELTRNAGGDSAVMKLAALSPEKVWENEVKPLFKSQLEIMDGAVEDFDDVSYRVVYVPLYFSRYVYRDKGYSFVLSGFNGLCWGEKPFGVGGLSHGLMKLFSGSSSTRVGVMNGKDLNALDCTHVYDNRAVFFCLPPSDQFFFSSSTGFAELENISDANIVLRAQFRGAMQYAKTLTIKPHEKLEFGYKRDWCLQIMEGNKDQIHWIVCRTCGGDKKPDSFGMVSPTMGVDEADLRLSKFVDTGKK